jgi:hypothetical protein
MYNDTERKMVASTPRHIRYTKRIWRVRALLSIAGSILLFLSIRQAVLDVNDLVNLSKYGKTIDIPITKRYPITETNQKYVEIHCLLEYRTYLEGELLYYTRKEIIGACRMPYEQNVTFTYWKQNSMIYRTGIVDTQRIVGQRNSWIFLISLLTLIFGTIIAALERYYREQRYLWQYGSFVRARVLQQFDATGNAITSKYIAYEFLTETDVCIRGQLQSRSGSVWVSSKVIGILYDPQNPARHRPVSWCRAAKIVE